MAPLAARHTHLGQDSLGHTYLANVNAEDTPFGDLHLGDAHLKDAELQPFSQPVLRQPGVEMVGGAGGTLGGGLGLVAAVAAGVGVVLLLVVGVWLARRWAAARKNAEERQQILLWPGAGTQPCTFQTREIRFTLPPSLAPLASAVPAHPPLPDAAPDAGPDAHYHHHQHASLTSLAGSGGGGGGSSGSSSTQDFASPSSSSLASLTSLEASGGGAAEARRSSVTDLRRRSLQGYSLGTLNPELYRIPDHLDDPGSYPEGHLGRLFLTLHYSQESEKLQVGLLRLRNLPSRTPGSTNACDPYVRLTVLPDERRYLQTKQKKKTCNPVFDEHFGFHIPLRCVAERTLRISVFDGGRHKRQPAIGHVFCPLTQVVADSAANAAAAAATDVTNPAIVMARDLVREEECEPRSDLGELLVSLTYNDTLHRLTLTVFQARGLKVCEGELVSWVKVSLMSQRRVIKSKKTAIVAAGDDSHYNESFHFRPPPALEGVHLTLQLYFAPNSNAKGRVVGRVVIGSFMFARGRALNHWNEVLSTPKEAIQYWHPLTE
ncbi:synaptotagmin-15-like isoform X2 [Panulirus ornatus]|uniref:synaptotagmin-15-like isoform X2 n=1 Tax=Panulirus ornatus TaxID=150431 RepID=UPI003A84DA48